MHLSWAGDNQSRSYQSAIDTRRLRRLIVYNYKIGKSSQPFAGGSFCCRMSSPIFPLVVPMVRTLRLSFISTSTTWINHLWANSSREPGLLTRHSSQQNIKRTCDHQFGRNAIPASQPLRGGLNSRVSNTDERSFNCRASSTRSAPRLEFACALQ